jgi:hypothetical protein
MRGFARHMRENARFFPRKRAVLAHGLARTRRTLHTECEEANVHRLYVPLNPAEFTQLQELATAERRPVQYQAAVIIAERLAAQTQQDAAGSSLAGQPRGVHAEGRNAPTVPA